MLSDLKDGISPKHKISQPYMYCNTGHWLACKMVTMVIRGAGMPNG